jgi:hypothetical protein
MSYRSDEVDQLMLALSAAHKEFGVIIEKDKKGHKGAYSSLPRVLDRIDKMNAKHGLILTQGSRIIDGHNVLETILTHPASKQWISSQSLLTPASGISPDQNWGGSKTYHRRYDAMSLMGIFCSDDPTDHDGWTEERVEEENQKDKNKPAQKSQVISDKQYSLLVIKLGQIPANRQKGLMNAAKIESWKELPWSLFNKVLERIEEIKSEDK